MEETDPIGSDDEADIIYKEEVEPEPEEPFDKIEKVLYHRIGPKWRELLFFRSSTVPGSTNCYASTVVYLAYNSPL